MSLQEYLISRGFPQAVTCPLDGQYHRFDHAGSLSGWLKGSTLEFQGKPVLVAGFGDFKTGEKFEFQSEVEGATTEIQTRLAQELAFIREGEAAERRTTQEKVAQELDATWGDAIDRGTTPYLKRKGLHKLYGAKICPDFPETLMVPARDVQGKLWTIQRILPTKLESGLDKLMKKGGRIEACFHLIGEISPEGEIYVCEGFATGASIHEALGKPVACAFNAGNLEAVACSLKEAYPSAKLSLCGDDDQWTTRYGKPYNPGREKALAAAHASGGVAIFPTFASLDGRPTDFNDLHAREGLARVKECLLTPPTATTQPVKKKFSEKLVAEWMLAAYPNTLIRQDKSLFHYDGRKWDELDSHGIDRLKNQINALCNDCLSSKDVASAYNTFFRYVPAVPPLVNLFQPRRDLANFENGTLHLEFQPKTPEEQAASPSTGTHVFSMRFAPHQGSDYCTTVLPLHYRPESDLPENAELQAMFKSVWPDSDQGGKIALYEELLGACLVPIFPQLFFFLGAPRTGKSSLIMLLGKIVGEANSSNADPTLWGQSFGMEDMVNKLVNFDTDISTSRRLPDDLTKKVIDGVFRITRKHKATVKVRLPAIHAFGANEMPKSAEGSSGAYGRRAVIIRTDTVQPGRGGGGEFSDWIWGRGKEGVLKAALRGLTRLLSNGGIYSSPDSSQAEMKTWQRDNDQVVQFIEAVEHGEISAGATGTAGVKGTIVVSESASISVSALYELFCVAVTKHDAHGNNRGKILVRDVFVKRLYRDRRFAPCRTRSERGVLGIGCSAQEE